MARTPEEARLEERRRRWVLWEGRWLPPLATGEGRRAETQALPSMCCIELTVRSVPTFMIYKDERKVKEMICPS
ncbi:hypothetical protein MUK42_15981 [Musa troglodytarum]|uniref:Thioredoxin domain-containing protein n=1 Tax=Musa troglodytarum TaxID=320322 RepID=A0A9E7IJ85_9LILI|nr:hypothetical protein MUK42_15981 [Musa troglodytarum]